MQTRITDQPVEQALAAIQALDLESVKLRITDPKLGEGWTRAHADSIEIAFKNYLTMLVKYQDDAEDILLSEDVDEFWHTYILQTIKYTDDCEAAFGKYLHHTPHIGEVTEADVERRTGQAEKTRRLYQNEFGSERDSNAAWLGTPMDLNNAAMSGAAIRVKGAAMSGAAVRAESAAMSGAAIRGESAAMSGAAIRGESAAMSGAAIRAESAAMSGAAIRARNAAMSGAAIRAESAAMSGAAIRAESAAMSGAAIPAKEPARAVAVVA